MHGAMHKARRSHEQSFFVTETLTIINFARHFATTRSKLFRTEKGNKDGWMDDLRFYILFNSISVI